MLKRFTLLIGVPVFFSLWVAIYFTTPGEAFEPWKGRATVKVNFRKSPKRNGQIIGLIKRGQEATIRDERNNWYQIVIEKETDVFTGWVYGKYVERIASEHVETSSAIEQIRASLASEKSETENTPRSQATKLPLMNGTGIDKESGALPYDNTTAQNDTIPVLKQEATVSQAEIDKVALEIEKPSQEKGSVARHEANPSTEEKSLVDEAKAYEAPPERDSTYHKRPYVPPLREVSVDEASAGPPEKASLDLKKPYTLPQREPHKVTDGVHREPIRKGIVFGKRPDATPIKDVHAVEMSQKSPFLKTETKEKDLSKRNKRSSVLSGVVIKLLAVALSCLAIMFAYKARQLARISYDVAVKFQHGI